MTTTIVVSPDELDQGEIVVEGDAYRHLFRARRTRHDEQIRVVDGRTRAVWATVVTIDRRRAVLAAGDTAPTNEPKRTVDLFVAPPRPERLAWLVEKATELGVGRVHLLATERGERRPGSGQVERLARVARAAVAQCHRTRVPAIDGPLGLDVALESVDRDVVRFVLDPAGDRVGGSVSGDDVAIFVGPEGGWTEAERSDLTHAGAVPVSFGDRILRVETAAIAAMARLVSV